MALRVFFLSGDMSPHLTVRGADFIAFTPE
jgi:hypothetical protein